MTPLDNTTAENIARKRQKARSVAIALGLVVLIVLFYLITIFKMGASVLNRSM